jgi:hypothetical protein
MVADCSAECSADDPVLVVPWDPDPAHPEIGHFVDLRANPYDLDQITEADHHPPLLQALRALNAARSPVFTAKCDAYPLAPDDLAFLQFALDRNPDPALGNKEEGFASYIDLVWRDRAVFVSFHQQHQRAQRLARLATALDHPDCVLEAVLRPAFVDIEGPQEGFAVTLYVKALGSDSAHAQYNWSRALEAVTTLLRSKEFQSS